MSGIIKDPIYAKMLFYADGILEHWTEDLTVHDKAAIQQRMKPGQTWLWQVRPTGTWLVRWDEDPNAGTKDSLVEILLRQAKRGDWANAEWHLIHVHEHNGTDAYGIVTASLPVDALCECLPRPKPQPLLPGERRYACAGGR